MKPSDKKSDKYYCHSIAFNPLHNVPGLDNKIEHSIKLLSALKYFESKEYKCSNVESKKKHAKIIYYLLCVECNINPVYKEPNATLQDYENGSNDIIGALSSVG